MNGIICFDIGGTKISKAVIRFVDTKKGYEIIDYEKEKNPREAEKIKDIMLSYCCRMKKAYRITKVAVSAACVVDTERLEILRAKGNYGIEKFSFDFLTRKGFALKVDNDGHCFVIGEHLFGNVRSSKILLGLVIGTGIGGGFFFNGLSFGGAHNTAMEVSHMQVNAAPDAPICAGCRRRGCWQVYSGGGGIERMYYRKTGLKKTAEQIFSDMVKDVYAKKIVAEAEEYMAIGLANVLNLLDPDTIVLGGSISQQKKFMERVIAKTNKKVFNKKARYNFKDSKLKEYANLLGAASLWIIAYFKEAE
jgi:predicted NBD/HSP70 family sugar kinase